MVNTMHRIIFILVAYAAVSFLSPAYAVSYYISNSIGDDSFDGLSQDVTGTTSGPKKTVSAAINLLNLAEPGDQILFKKGDTWMQSIEIKEEVVGLPGNPIIMGAYGSGALPKFDIIGDGAKALAIHGRQITPPQHLKILDLHFTSSGGENNRPSVGMRIFLGTNSMPHHISLSGVTIENMQGGIINYSDFLTIENSIIQDNGPGSSNPNAHGIFISSVNGFTLKNSYIKSNGVADSNFSHQVYLAGSRNTLIENSFFEGGSDGIKIRAGSNITIRNNIISDPTWTGVTMGGQGLPSDAGLDRVIIEGNTISNTAAAIAINDQSGASTTGSSNIIIRNNNFSHPIPAPFSSWPGFLIVTPSPARNISILSNIFWDIGSSPAILVTNKSFSNSEIKHNLLHRTNSINPLLRIDSGAINNAVLDYNKYLCEACNIITVIGGSSYTDLSSFKARYTSKEANGISGNPANLDGTGINIDFINFKFNQ